MFADIHYPKSKDTDILLKFNFFFTYYIANPKFNTPRLNIPDKHRRLTITPMLNPIKQQAIKLIQQINPPRKLTRRIEPKGNLSSKPT